MKKPNSIQQKLTELEYVSMYRNGKVHKMQKSMKEMEDLLKKANINKKKK